MDKSVDDLMTDLMDTVRGKTGITYPMNISEATDAGSSDDGVYMLDTDTNTWYK